MSRAVLVCEGYDDRDFIGQWLRARGWLAMGAPGKSPPEVDGLRVNAGEHAFRRARGPVIVVAPAGGDARVEARARDVLVSHTTRPVVALGVVLDADVEAEGAVGSPRLARHGSGHARLDGLVRRLQASVPPGTAAPLISGWAWCDAAAAQPTLPPKQTLERLAMAALVEAYPERAPAVAAFLAATPEGPPPTGKSYFWAHLAKWYPLAAGDGGIGAIWRDEPVVAALCSRMQGVGADAWVRALEQLAR